MASQWTQYAVDDVSHLGTHTMTCGPTVNFSTPTGSAVENAGTITVNMTISPATSSAGTISITIGGSSSATYGTDYTTTPAAAASVITINVPSGATAASFTISINDDAITEPNETIDLAITGSNGGIFIGSAVSHVFTIIDNDTVPTIDFSTLNITVLESAGLQTFYLSILPTTHGSGFATITISGASTATYGSDYTTNPAPVGATITVGWGPNVPTFSFTATVINDLIPEPTENVIFTITGVSAGFAIGSNNTATLVIGDNDSPPTSLTPGDLAIVGVNANEGGCAGVSGEDRISFFCYKEIVYGTEIILTDNGYERCNPGQWGNGEGTVRMKRTGPAIPAGQVITFKVNTSSGPTNVQSMAPDAQWTCTSITAPGGTATSLNMNNGGDQLFFMQGGTWTSGASGGNNATYSGTILFGFTTNPSPPWTASCSTNPTQRSNLPPGVECFSMAPTLASDFNKYIGPTTAATQRDWIIRIEDPSNWTSYPSCSDYNTFGYNWLSAPILPIIPGAMVHGLWRGAINTDWFECRNWDDARVPDALTNVVIDASSIRACDVGLNPGVQPGGTGSCASVWQHFSLFPPKALSVQPNSTLNVGGLYKLENTNASNLTVQVLANATLNADSVEVSGTALGASNCTMQLVSANSQLVVTGNFRLKPGGRLHMQGALGSSGTLVLGGNFINQEDELHFLDINSQVVLNGGTDQYIQNSNPMEYFYNMRVAKSGGDVHLTAPVAIRNQLDLTQGRIFSSPANLISLLSGATAVNYSNASFVHGPLQRTGSTDFTFPIGKNNSCRPAGLQNLTAGGVFTAEYFAADPEVAIAPLAPPTTLDHISHCEYWNIDRMGATPYAQVVLSWGTPESCGVTAGALGELRVAHWNGTIWDDRGNGGTTGTALSGTVSTAAVETGFSPWTLASVTANNPLPIELLSFTATPSGRVVDLNWSTASERNNAFFTVERGMDAVHFDAINQLPGAGNSQSVTNYTDVDRAPLHGLSYYRLRQTDQDGTSTLSEAVPVLFQGTGGLPLTVLYGQDGLYLLHDLPKGSVLEVLDATGRMIRSVVINMEGLCPVPMEGVAHGMYILRASSGSRMESTQLAY